MALKERISERGAAWTAISENLRQVESPKFNVDQRSVREHYKLLVVW